MAQNSEKDAPALSSRFAELNKFAQNQEFAKALKVANRSRFCWRIIEFADRFDIWREFSLGICWGFLSIDIVLQYVYV